MAAPVAKIFALLMICCAAVRPEENEELKPHIDGGLHGESIHEHQADANATAKWTNKCCCYRPGALSMKGLWLKDHNDLDVDHCPSRGCYRETMGLSQQSSREECTDGPTKGDLFCDTTRLYECDETSHPSPPSLPSGWDKCYAKGGSAPSASTVRACEQLTG
mmetsp:Transcript_55607/g.125070  ORF Transcript_55607/g.125070 Transcript_55607/m.125070 type:complete len:163 (-) Transcript_55607:90-578(-)